MIIVAMFLLTNTHTQIDTSCISVVLATTDEFFLCYKSLSGQTMSILYSSVRQLVTGLSFVLCHQVRGLDKYTHTYRQSEQ